MIQDGKRNFAVDLSTLDYIYSDAMNKILVINRHVLDVNGRLVLVGPQPEVRQILERAGINNFLRIYASEADLTRSSEEIIKQTQSLSLDSIKSAQAGAAPKSDFEDFRSEINRVFEEPSIGAGPSQPAAPQAPRPPMPPRRSEAVPPPPQAGFPPMPPLGAPRMPSFPQAAPMPQQFAQQQQFYQQQPQQQFAQPAMPQNPMAGDFRVPPQMPSMPPPQQFMPQASSQEPVEDFQDFEAKAQPARQRPAFEEDEPIMPKPVRSSESELRRRSSLDLEIEKKKFPVGILIVVVLLLAIGGAGYFLVQQGIIKFTKTEPQESVKPASTEIPQVQVEDERKVQAEDEKVLAAADSKELETGNVPEPQVKRLPPRTKAAATQKRAARPAVSEPAPAAQSTVSEPKVTNQIVITSLPPGASVVIDGETVGTTPLTLSNPSAYGEITIEASKPGWQSQKKSSEYAGGILKEHFALEREAPPPATAMTVPAEEKPVRRPDPPPAPKPVQAAPVLPVAPAPAAMAPAPAAVQGGDPGTIFIASIPPVADVFMDGTRIGKTNVEELKVTAGTHMMKFVKGPKEIEKEMTFQAGKNASQMIRIP